MIFQLPVRSDLRLDKSSHPIERLFDRIFAHAWISYALIFVLQLKIIWNMWKFRDLTTGDTSSYFVDAYRWYEHFHVNFVWSPLYTAFYGSILQATHGDVLQATIFHRVIIVMLAAMGVLSLMRSLMPAALALLIAAWWAVLPINFNTLYEVHLFGLLPILIAWLAVAMRDTPWTWAWALAILFASTFLMRNEDVVALAVFAAICGVRELRQSRLVSARRSVFCKGRAFIYGIPMLCALFLIAMFYWRSIVRFPQIFQALHLKHTVNMCQVYAFGYAERHPDWTFSPWLECAPLMQTVFGHSMPTLVQMLAGNPPATIMHFLWNLSLTFNGLQVALFNMMSGTVNPDYAPVSTNVTAASLLSIFVLAILVAGGVKLIRHWDYWFTGWLRERRGLMLAMLSVLWVSVPVILVERPRPSYLFASTLVIMAAIGFAGYVLLENRRMIFAKVLAILGVPALAFLMPSYYATHQSDRPLYTDYLRLEPSGALLQSANNRIIFGDYAGELRNYLLLQSDGSQVFDYGILSSWQAPQTLDQFLNAHKINVLFVQPRLMDQLASMPTAQQILQEPESLGWRRLAPAGAGAAWLLLYRPPQN